VFAKAEQSSAILLSNASEISPASFISFKTSGCEDLI
jgi:hypothetical protein